MKERIACASEYEGSLSGERVLLVEGSLVGELVLLVGGLVLGAVLTAERVILFER